MSNAFARARLFVQRIREMRGRPRIAALLGLTAILIYKTRELALFLRAELVAHFSRVDAGVGQFVQANDLVFFDVFVLIALVGGGLIALNLAAGQSENSKRPFFAPPLRGRPIITFALFAPAIALLLWLTPSYLANLVFVNDPKGVFLAGEGCAHPYWPNAAYVRAAFLTAAVLAASLADLAAKPGATHWWLLPTFFVPPQWAPVALLWWNAAAGWLPSRLWSAWRPLLAAATCAPLLVTAVMAQPLRRNYLFYDGMRSSRVVRFDQPCNRPSYQATRSPDRPDLFLRCGPGLMQYRRGITNWDLVGDLDLGTQWNRAGFDFTRRLAFVFLPRIAKIAAVDIAAPPPRVLRLVPTEPFSRMGDFISLQLLLDVDAARGVLFVADNRGMLRAYDENSLAVLHRVDLAPESGVITEMLFDAQRHQLLVLQANRLTIFNSPYLSLAATLPLKSMAFGMALDQHGDRLFIGLPETAQVVVLARDTLQETARGDAPAGVRVLAIDAKRHYLFLAAMTGVVETRGLEDLRLLGRTRLIPWIHGIEVFPESGELMVTGGEVIPVMWRYEPPGVRWSFFDLCLRVFESIWRASHAKS